MSSMATYESSTVKNPRACLINEENTTVHSLVFGLDLGQEACEILLDPGLTASGAVWVAMANCRGWKTSPVSLSAKTAAILLSWGLPLLLSLYCNHGNNMFAIFVSKRIM